MKRKMKSALVPPSLNNAISLFEPKPDPIEPIDWNRPGLMAALKQAGYSTEKIMEEASGNRGKISARLLHSLKEINEPHE